MSSRIYGVRLDQINYVTGTVQPGGQLIGWEFIANTGSYCWSFRRDISEFYDASEVSGALTIKGLTDGSSAALIRWNNTPMTDEQLTKIEQNEGRLLNGIPNPLATTYSLNDLRFAALRAQGYNGHTNDMLIDWLLDNGADVDGPQHINDLWKSFLIAQGAAVAGTYQYNDARRQFYIDQGYTQRTLNDLEVAFWRAGGIIT